MIADGELPTAIAVSGQAGGPRFPHRRGGGYRAGAGRRLLRLGEDLVDSTVGMFRTLPGSG